MRINMADGTKYEALGITISDVVDLINRGAKFIEIECGETLEGIKKNSIINADMIISFENYADHIEKKLVTDEEKYANADKDNNVINYEANTPYTPDEVKEDDRNFRLE